MACHSLILSQTVAFVSLLVLCVPLGLGQTHRADAIITHEPVGVVFYAGTSNPGGPYLINLAGSAPGYLNGVSGGGSGGTEGDFNVGQQPVGTPQLVALSIHVTDSAGPSHSLSALNDPALTDIVNDLNTTSGGGDAPVLSYAYNTAPAQFTAAKALLTSGESANGGQPFDILLTSTTPSLVSWWATGFSSEIGNLDGITALSVTDIGDVTAPEPSMAGALALSLAGVLMARRRRSQKVFTTSAR